MTENPWAKAKQLNAVHRNLMAVHPMKENRTPEDETAWNENIALYEDLLRKTLVRQHDGSVAFPFRTEQEG